MEEIRIGICAEPGQVARAARAGYDYLEMDVNRILAMDEDA